MAQIRRTVLGILALVTGIAITDGKAAWAQGIPRLDARVIAINIPGASAVSQVGTFLSGPPTPFGQCTLPHPVPGFPPLVPPHSTSAFIQPGAVLDPKRILVGSRSNFGAPIALNVGQEGSFLSIDPNASLNSSLSVPPNFAQSGVQASTLGGAVQMFSANSNNWLNSVNNPNASTNNYTGVSNPLGLSNNNAFGRLWPANAPFGDTGVGSSSVLDPDGRPLAKLPSKAPSPVIGGVYVGNLTNRQVVAPPQVIPGSLSTGAVGTAFLGPSLDGTCRAVFSVVTADGAIVQEHTQKGLDGIAPAGTVQPLDQGAQGQQGSNSQGQQGSNSQGQQGSNSQGQQGSSGSQGQQGSIVEPRLGVLMNPYTTAKPFTAWQLFVSEPFNNTIAVINLVQSGTGPTPNNQVFALGSVSRISSPLLNLPVDLAPVTRDADSATWASNTTLDSGSDFYVANRGNNTIVRMTQGGSVVATVRVTIDSLPLNDFAINGIARSVATGQPPVDPSKIYVTFTTPTNLQGGLLEVPAF
jgi:hypothetical protein